MFIKGAIVQSLIEIFGQIGGQTELDLLKFDELKRTGILRVALDFSVKIRAALTLINSFQGNPAVFTINHSSTQLASLAESFVEI